MWLTVGVLAAVGHAQETLAGVLELEVLIRELGAVDGLAAGALQLLANARLLMKDLYIHLLS